VALPPIAPTPPEQAQTLAAVRGGETAQGVPLRAASAMVRLEDGRLLQISAAHVMGNEQKLLARYRLRIGAAVIVAVLLIALLGYGG
ncbi:two-component sensor histidine kinase, partial [Serratia marcescens]|nr:two-component sensor histidine kinase [Serratia marcescens]